MRIIDKLSDVTGQALGPLANAPVLLSVTHDIDKDIRTYRAVIASNLTQQSTLELAHTAAPGRKMDITEVRADWVIVTPQDPQEELRQKHVQGLGNIWTSVTQHLPVMHHILGGMPDKPADQVLVANLHNETDARRHLVGNLVNLTTATRSSILKACSSNDILQQEMTIWHRNRRKTRRTKGKAALRMGGQRDRQLLQDLCMRHPSKVAEYVPATVIEDQFIDVPGTPLKTRSMWQEAIKHGMFVKYRKNRASSYLMNPIQPADTKIIFSHQRDWPRNAAFPSLEWKSNNGIREWVDHQDQDTMKQEAFDLSGLRAEDYETWANPLAGLLTIASQSPDIVQGWPKQMQLKPNGLKQEMGTAQTPGLVYMFRQQLLRSAFMDRLEAEFEGM